MDKIIIDFIGPPRILMDRELVKIPLKKAEGLLYMLLLEGQMERVKLCTYFWPESNLETGRRNLRNAIYTLKKNLKPNVFKVADRSSVELDRDLFLLKGIDGIDEGGISLESHLLESDNINFMDDFNISNLDEFGGWINYQRNRNMAIFERILYSEVTDGAQTRQTRINTCKKLIRHCSFNEKYYIELIRLYRDKGELKKCISIYGELEEILREEFSLTPSKEAFEIIEEIKEKRSRRREANRLGIASSIRGYDLLLMLKDFEDFKKTATSKALMISGERGIGKTTLLASFRRKIGNDCIIMDMKCLKTKRNSYYGTLKPLVDRLMKMIRIEGLDMPEYMSLVLSTYLSSVKANDHHIAERTKETSIMEQVIIGLITILGTRKQLVIIVDDINLMDPMSFRVISKIISQVKDNIFTVLTCERKTDTSKDRMLQYLKSRDFLNEIEISRLNRKETFRLIESRIDLDEDSKGYIYEESDGIPLFIMEFIKNIKDKESFDIRKSRVDELIRERMKDLDSELKDFVEVCSLFYNEIKLNDLTRISGIDEIRMIDIVEDLIDHNILHEQKGSGDEIELVFSHNQIRAFLRREMAYPKRNLWVGKFTEYYEGRKKDL